MANSMGSLYIGVSGLQTSQNALNMTANNLANVDTEGYVRERILQQDRNYVTMNMTTFILPHLRRFLKSRRSSRSLKGPRSRKF